jgi:uncharacterized protein
MHALSARAVTGDAGAMVELFLACPCNPDGSRGAEAIYWLQEAAIRNYPEAQFLMGVLHEHGDGLVQNNGLAAQWYAKAAGQGHAEAQYNLGYFYETGKGIGQNYGQAAYWYALSAGQGFAHAQNNLGVLYSSGKGVEQDQAKAAELYRKADAGSRLQGLWSGWDGPQANDKLSPRHKSAVS